MNITDCKKVLIPLNPNTNHWAFIHVDIPKKLIVYHDSFDYKKENAMKMMNVVRQFIEQAIKHEQGSQKATMNGHGKCLEFCDVICLFRNFQA